MALPSQMPGRQCQWCLLPSAGQCRCPVGSQSLVRSPAARERQGLAPITQKVSQARILAVLKVTGSLYDSGLCTCSCLPHPMLHSIERGCSCCPGPSLFCLQLSGLEAQSCKQVSADRDPRLCRKIPVPDNPPGNYSLTSSMQPPHPLCFESLSSHGSCLMGLLHPQLETSLNLPI